ncbi:MAG: hypothetical protein PUF51_00435 [Bifidobacteriaceae bacterium]|nr:hypothetical protein [Bifidobacteriaceae bacterium]
MPHSAENEYPEDSMTREQAMTGENREEIDEPEAIRDAETADRTTPVQDAERDTEAADAAREYESEEHEPEEYESAGAADAEDYEPESLPDDLPDDGDDRLGIDDDIEYDDDDADDAFDDDDADDDDDSDPDDADDVFDDDDDDGDAADEDLDNDSDEAVRDTPFPCFDFDFGDDFGDEDDDGAEGDEDDEDYENSDSLAVLIASHMGKDGMLPRDFSLVKFAPGYDDIKDDLADLSKLEKDARKEDARADGEGTAEGTDEGIDEGADEVTDDDGDDDLLPLQYSDGFTDGMELYGTGVGKPTKEQIATIHAMVRAIQRDDDTFGDMLDDLADTLPAIEAEEELNRAISEFSDDNEFLDRLVRLGVALVCNAADPFLVKYGLVMLEGFDLPEDIKEILRMMGRCDEFTLFVITCMHRWEESNEEIYYLAQHVEGWGRIHCVADLQPADYEQREWLLSEGWRNTVAASLSALDCFVKGGAPQLLEDANLGDDELSEEEFADIADLLTVLIDEDGIIAPGISALEDAEDIVMDFLQVAAQREEDGELTENEQDAVDLAEQYLDDVRNGAFDDDDDDTGDDAAVVDDTEDSDSGTEGNGEADSEGAESESDTRD